MQKDWGMTVNSKNLHTTFSSPCVCIQKVLCHGAVFRTTFAHCPMISCSYIEVVFLLKIYWLIHLMDYKIKSTVSECWKRQESVVQAVTGDHKHLKTEWILFWTVKGILSIGKRREVKKKSDVGSFMQWKYLCWGRVGNYKAPLGLLKSIIFEIWNDST